MSKPFVSVLMDTYNHERFIEQALVSVLEQEALPDDAEILVVDDGSADRTPEVVRKFAPRVRHLYKANGGQASAFNAGIPEARGEIVCFLDGDDWWAKHKLRTVLEVFEKNLEVGTVGHGFYEVDVVSGRSGLIVPERTSHLDLRTRDGAVLFRLLKCFLGTSRIAVRRTVLERIVPIPEPLIIEADEFMNTLAVGVAGAIVLDQPLTHYRLHPGNLFQFRGADSAKLRRKYEAMACLVRELPQRLAALGVSQEVVEAVVAPVWAEAERLGLTLNGGKPWQTFRVERKDFELAYKDAGYGYRLFKAAVLALTLVLPPRQFYRLKQWYAAKGLRKLRRLVGEPTPAAPIVERR